MVDADGDGVMDVYVSRFSASDMLYMNDGAGVFTEAGAAAGVGTPTSRNSDGVVGVDLELDGDMDVFVGVTNSAHLAWIHDGKGAFVDVAAVL